MKVLNNKGMTLVEIVLTIVIIGIIGVSLTSCFVSSFNIINRATLYKNISSSAAATVELNEEQEPIIANEYDVALSEKNSTVTVKYKKGNTPEQTISMKGQYIFGNAKKDDISADLTYKEFLPSNYSYDIPAEVIE